jgi:acyl carrier protein
MRVGHEAGAGADIAPAEDIRRSITDIACGVLERDHIEPAVDLFDQGATSLAYIRIVAEINEKYDINLDVAQLEEASIDSLAAVLQIQVPGWTGRSIDSTPITASASH